MIALRKIEWRFDTETIARGWIGITEIGIIALLNRDDSEWRASLSIGPAQTTVVATFKLAQEWIAGHTENRILNLIAES